jgi:hypothetical protein
MSTHNDPSAHPASNSGASSSRKGTFTDSSAGNSVFTGKPNSELGDFDGCNTQPQDLATEVSKSRAQQQQQQQQEEEEDKAKPNVPKAEKLHAKKAKAKTSARKAGEADAKEHDMIYEAYPGSAGAKGAGKAIGKPLKDEKERELDDERDWERIESAEAREA